MTTEEEVARLIHELKERDKEAVADGERYVKTLAALDAALADAARLREALEHKGWSYIRTLLEQGRAIEQDNAAGKYPTYEHLAARVDAAARARHDELRALAGSKE